MPLFPLFANLEGREVLVIGGGEVAQRKIEALLKVKAALRVHAHELNATLTQWHQHGLFERLQGDFDATWLDRVWLVVAASSDRDFNAMLANEAGRRLRLVNVVDDAELSTFHIPAIIDRDPLQIAISSSGAAPMLARRLRERLEAEIDESLGTLARLFAEHRQTIRKAFPDLTRRRRWFERVLDGPVPILLQSGETGKAERTFMDSLTPDLAGDSGAGRVIVVEAGHADPGLLTLKALRSMNLADLLVCDKQVSPAVVQLARRDAHRVAAPDEEQALTAMLMASAKAGLCAVHLYARGALQPARHIDMRPIFEAQGISYDFVPGITADWKT
jgi:precorrin-2 dehydrogenase / sirohydrochlorin ferrochelatase